MLAANHISWLDILVMHAARHCRFVSKSDVKHWPLIGTLATGAGTLYIERESRRDAMRGVHHMAEGSVSAMWPGTILQHHPHVTVLLDEAAAGRLQLAGYYRETYAAKPAWQGL